MYTFVCEPAPALPTAHADALRPCRTASEIAADRKREWCRSERGWRSASCETAVALIVSVLPLQQLSRSEGTAPSSCIHVDALETNTASRGVSLSYQVEGTLLPCKPITLVQEF